MARLSHQGRGIKPWQVHAGASTTNEDGIALGIQKGSHGKLAQLTLIHRGVGEDKAIEVFQHRELGTPMR